MQELKLFHHTSPRSLHAAEPTVPYHPLVEPSLFYDPPYERPLEDEFAWQLVKYLQPISGLQYQVKIETLCAHVWVDFVVEHGARRIGLDIGNVGEESDEDQKRYRDALILGSGALDVLYRFRGADLMFRPHDALHLAAKWDPNVFSPRGHINLNTLASGEARACRPRPQDTRIEVVYEQPGWEDHYEDEAFAWPQEVPPTLIVRRLSRVNPAAWLRDYDAALRHFGVSDERLSAQWAKSA